MKIRTFKYKKDVEQKIVRALILSENDSHMMGISYEHLTEDEIKDLIKVQEDYENALEPFMKKAFRQYLKNKITETFL